MTTLNKNVVEESMLQEWMTSKTQVTVYLKNGISLKGLIVGYADDIISLSNDTLISKVFKQAITTISPYIPKG